MYNVKRNCKGAKWWLNDGLEKHFLVQFKRLSFFPKISNCTLKEMQLSCCLVYHWSLDLLPFHSLFFVSGDRAIFSRLRKGITACFCMSKCGKQRHRYFPGLLKNILLLSHRSSVQQWSLKKGKSCPSSKHTYANVHMSFQKHITHTLQEETEVDV